MGANGASSFYYYYYYYHHHNCYYYYLHYFDDDDENDLGCGIERLRLRGGLAVGGAPSGRDKTGGRECDKTGGREWRGLLLSLFSRLHLQARPHPACAPSLESLLCRRDLFS